MHRQLLVLIAFAATATVAQFSYNPTAPLDPQLVNRERIGAVLVQDITYSSPKGGRVPAYLFTTMNASPSAAVVFVHWGLGDRHAFYDDAMELARYGVHSLLIDAPFTRADAPKNENDDVTQAVVEARRGVDLLVARKDVDPKRIGFVGLSYGAHVGAILASVEPRIRAFVLAGGLASNADAEKNPALAPNDAEKFIGKGQAPVFLQFAHNDEYISRDQASRFIKAAGDRAIYKWYEGGHEFNAAARNDRESWLATELGFEINDLFYRPIGPVATVPARLEIGKLGVVTDVPGMQHISVRNDVAFKSDLKMDVYYPFAMTPKDHVPAIIEVNGQSDDAAFMKSMRQMRFATTFAQALAARTNRIVVVPDIRAVGSGDPAADLHDLITFLTTHADELQIDATQIGILSRSAGYSYALKAATTNPSIKALAIWYGNLGDPKIQSMLSKNPPMLVVTAQHDFWYDAAAAKKFVDATGAQHIHLPDAGHAFEIIDDLDQSRDAFVKTATFLRDHLPVHH